MQLRSLFLGLLLAICLVTVVASSLVMANQWREHSSLASGSAALKLYQSALYAAEIVSKERGPANSAMGADFPTPDALQSGLHDARLKSDNVLKELLDRSSEAGSSAQSVARQIERAIAQLSSARGSVDALLKKPKASRESRELVAAVTSLYLAVDLLKPVIASIQSEIIRIAPDAGTQVITARLLAEFREQAGRLGSELTPALMQGRPLLPKEVTRVDAHQGRVEQLYELVISHVNNNEPESGLARGISEIEKRYMTYGLSLVEGVREYDGVIQSAAEFAKRYVPSMLAIIETRDAQLLAAQNNIEAKLQKSRWILVIGATSSMCLIIMVIAVSLVFWRNIINPVSEAARQLESEANHHPGVTKLGDADRLKHASHVLRANKVMNLMLEKDKSDAMNFISHDMRSPLTAILSLVENQGHQDVAVDEATFRARVATHADRTLDLLDRFIELAQTQAVDSQFDEIDLRFVVADVMEDVRDIAVRKRMQIRSAVPNDGAYVLGDHSMLCRVVSNLVENAVKFGFSESDIVLELKSSGDVWAISVRNCGEGIEPQHIEGIFEKYKRAGNYNCTPGFGLGLAYVHAAVTRHGGEVSVASIPGEMTTFVVSLPALA